ncbi:MAG: hypothetical protein A2270_09395 [Elusimicrobia bacterium RIFOXYA12_FULL_51_18]|nr:MAG: hypothetical protein A2270_09395 [Elusimicrobia bacterium RIFOXYA12_FULL_51_18]OGS32717.1 MAG: hypothetical protein A2218_11710 [Elusimicrobia bacterium RIFOXYA2_FULL_53_38]
MKSFYFYLLWRCNEDCLFCAKGKPPRNAKKEFTPVEACSIIKEKRKEGYDKLVLDGGEPTLYPALDRIIYIALEAGYKEINIVTNGVVLADKKKVAKLLNAHAKAGQKTCRDHSGARWNKECSDIELRGFRRGSAGRFAAVKDFADKIGFSKITAESYLSDRKRN